MRRPQSLLSRLLSNRLQTISRGLISPPFFLFLLFFVIIVVVVVVVVASVVFLCFLLSARYYFQFVVLWVARYLRRLNPI